MFLNIKKKYKSHLKSQALEFFLNESLFITEESHIVKLPTENGLQCPQTPFSREVNYLEERGQCDGYTVLGRDPSVRRLDCPSPHLTRALF